MLHENIIQDISDFIFVENEPQAADVIFIPGSSKYEPLEKAAALYKNGLAKYVLPTGKYSLKRPAFPDENISDERYRGCYKTENEFGRFVLVYNGVPSAAILCEDCSGHTSENAFMSRAVTDALHINVRQAIICCQAFHARRVFITWSLAYPETELFIVPVATQGISKDNWYKSAHGIARVMGELRKCGEYFAGDIAAVSGRL